MDDKTLALCEELYGRTKKANRWVVKVGTSVLTDAEQVRVAKHCVEEIADEVTGLWQHGKEVILVTSGAIGIGMGVLDLEKRPSDLAKLQAAAATGQGKLMQWYTSQMDKSNCHAAQVLLTRGDLEDRQRRSNVKATLETLLAARIVPIINENDTVSTEEIKFGDNDLLSAHVAVLMNADLLVLLTDVDKITGPEGPEWVVPKRNMARLKKSVRGTTKAVSTGGMKTKLEAAKIAVDHKISVWIMNGRNRPNLIGLTAVPQGHVKGTWFIP